MAEPTCVMHPFSYTNPPPPFSNEAHEEINPTMYGLAESVSFGRYVCEDLEWEKWSSFNSTNRNRYVAEAEKYSKPGSVAQKKAYFEAHFKRMAALKAAALLEQAQSNVLHDHAQDLNSNLNSNSNSKLQAEAKDFQQAENCSAGGFVVHQNELFSPEAKHKDEDNDHKGKDVNPSPPPPLPPPPPPLDHKLTTTTTQYSPNKLSLAPKDEAISVKKEENHPDCESTTTTQYSPNKLSPTQKDEAISIKKEEDHPDHKSTTTNQYNPNKMSPAWGGEAISVKKEENHDVHNEELSEIMNQMEIPLLKEESTEVAAVVKKKKTPLSSYISSPSVVFAPSPVKSDYIHPGKENYSTPVKSSKSSISSDPQKRKTSLRMSINREFNRILSPVIKKLGSSSKTSTPSKTPAKASMNNDISQSQPMTPDLSKRGTAASPSTGRSKASSPIIPNSFCLKNGERTTRRKQKLEEKFNATTTERVPQPSKFKEKAEAELNKFRQSFCFKAMSSPDHYGDNGTFKSPKHKNESTHRKSPHGGRQSNRTASQNSTLLPPRRPSVNQNGLKSKRNTLVPS